MLEHVSQQTGLRFRVPDRPHASTRAPFFYSLAAGFQAMESLAKVFSIPDFIWQQQGDGEVYVGSWADSYFGMRPALQLPVELFDNYQGNQSATIAVLPGLRPGATINQSERVTHVALAGNQMNVLQVLCDLLDLVQEMNIQLAGHVHGSTPAPNNATAFTKAASSAMLMGLKFESIKL